jgi:hypothetical protein
MRIWMQRQNRCLQKLYPGYLASGNELEVKLNIFWKLYIEKMAAFDRLRKVG